MEQLHPNLARIAAAYDQICAQYANGQLDAEEANRRITALAARDDNGVIWTIDPASGAWVYRTIDGQLVAGTPPMSGFATPSPFDVTRNPQGPNPNDRLATFEVDDPITPPGALAGTTRPEIAHLPGERRFNLVVNGKLLAGIGLIAALIAVFVLN